MSRPRRVKLCAHCDQEFWPKKGNRQQYCSMPCARKARAGKPNPAVYLQDPTLRCEACGGCIALPACRQAECEAWAADWLRGPTRSIEVGLAS